MPDRYEPLSVRRLKKYRRELCSAGEGRNGGDYSLHRVRKAYDVEYVAEHRARHEQGYKMLKACLDDVGDPRYFRFISQIGHSLFVTVYIVSHDCRIATARFTKNFRKFDFFC